MTYRALFPIALFSFVVVACAGSGNGGSGAPTEHVTARSSKLVQSGIQLLSENSGPFATNGAQTGPFSIPSNPGPFGPSNPGIFGAPSSPGPFVGPGGSLCSELCSFVSECFGEDVPADCASECDIAFTSAASDAGAFPCLPELITALDCVFAQISCSGGEPTFDVSAIDQCIPQAESFAQCLGVDFDISGSLNGSGGASAAAGGNTGAGGNTISFGGSPDTGSGGSPSTTTGGTNCTALVNCCGTASDISGCVSAYESANNNDAACAAAKSTYCP